MKKYNYKLTIIYTDKNKNPFEPHFSSVFYYEKLNDCFKKTGKMITPYRDYRNYETISYIGHDDTHEYLIEKCK